MVIFTERYQKNICLVLILLIPILSFLVLSGATAAECSPADISKANVTEYREKLRFAGRDQTCDYCALVQIEGINLENFTLVGTQVEYSVIITNIGTSKINATINIAINNVSQFICNVNLEPGESTTAYPVRYVPNGTFEKEFYYIQVRGSHILSITSDNQNLDLLRFYHSTLIFQTPMYYTFEVRSNWQSELTERINSIEKRLNEPKKTLNDIINDAGTPIPVSIFLESFRWLLWPIDPLSLYSLFLLWIFCCYLILYFRYAAREKKWDDEEKWSGLDTIYRYFKAAILFTILLPLTFFLFSLFALSVAATELLKNIFGGYVPFKAFELIQWGLLFVLLLFSHFRSGPKPKQSIYYELVQWASLIAIVVIFILASVAVFSKFTGYISNYVFWFGLVSTLGVVVVYLILWWIGTLIRNAWMCESTPIVRSSKRINNFLEKPNTTAGVSCLERFSVQFSRHYARNVAIVLSIIVFFAVLISLLRLSDAFPLGDVIIEVLFAVITVILFTILLDKHDKLKSEPIKRVADGILDHELRKISLSVFLYHKSAVLSKSGKFEFESILKTLEKLKTPNHERLLAANVNLESLEESAQQYKVHLGDLVCRCASFWHPDDVTSLITIEQNFEKITDLTRLRKHIPKKIFEKAIHQDIEEQLRSVVCELLKLNNSRNFLNA